MRLLPPTKETTPPLATPPRESPAFSNTDPPTAEPLPLPAAIVTEPAAVEVPSPLWISTDPPSAEAAAETTTSPP